MTTLIPDFNPLDHIETAAQECLDFLGNMSFDDFFNDRKTRAAVVWQICVIGEAANRVDEDIQRQAPEMDWRQMVDMRNVLIHQYHRINYGLVWNTAKDGLPPLITSVRRLLDDQDNGPC